MSKSETSVVTNESDLKNMFQRKGGNNYYEDNDLKTHGHDKIMDQLINNVMITKIANISIREQAIWYGNNEIEECIFNNATWHVKEEFLVDKYHFRFIDLNAVLINTQCMDNKCEYYKTKENTFNYMCGSPSHCYHGNEGLALNIEVKTSIPSIGELIRQINIYKELYHKDACYIVITPNVTESLKNRLKNANIHLIDTKELGIIS